jgi:hypothetical protein
MALRKKTPTYNAFWLRMKVDVYIKQGGTAGIIDPVPAIKRRDGTFLFFHP